MKHWINSFAFLIVASLFCGCNNSENLDKSRWNAMEYILTHEELYPNKEILSVKGLTLTDSLLLVKGSDAQGMFSLFRQKDDSILYLYSIINKGRGMIEANNAKAFFIPENEALVVEEFNPYGKFIVIPINDIGNTDQWRVNYKHNKSKVSYGAVVPIDTTNYIALNYSESSKNIFLLFSLKDSLFSEIEIPFPENAEGLSIGDKAMHVFSINYLIKRPGHNEFVYCFQNGHFAETFKLDKDYKSVISRHKIFDQTPTFQTSNSKILLDNSVESGFRICANEDYIYLMDPKIKYKDRARAKEMNGYQPGYIKEIYVSDWSGKPVIKFITDIPIANCSVDKDNNYLYASTYDKDSLIEKVVRFKLPKFN